MKAREKELAAFRAPFNAKNWNVASLNTKQGTIYLTIPKKLLSLEKFENLVKSLQGRINKKQPLPTMDELRLVFALPLYVSTQKMFQVRREGEFAPASEKQIALLEAGKFRPTKTRVLGKRAAA
jgi:hypothetical protein